jgi:hypothetical protein
MTSGYREASMITSIVKAASYFHRPCTAIAARLGAGFPEFPGGHLAPMELPVPFAAGLRDVFGRL